MNYKAIQAAMQAELDNPLACYMPNSPGAFVRDRLMKEMLWEEGIWFWSNYCRGGFNIPDLDVLYNKLQELTKKDKMPDWGTYGS
jgi:hypothetical protein